MLDPAAVAEFAEAGFLSGLDVLDAAEVRTLRAAVDEVRHNLDRYADDLYEVEQSYLADPDSVVCHFLGGWRLQAPIRELLFDPRVTRPLAQLLGVDRLRFWHDQVFFKPARHPGVVPWHQDYSYWQRTVPDRHITMFLALDDHDVENGCLQYVPGSHRWGLLPAVPFDAGLQAIHPALDAAQQAAFRPVHSVLRAGQASIHHSHTLHGSDRNDSDRSRCGLVLNYMAADTRSATDEPLLRGVPVIPAGAIVAGECFPVVLGDV